MGLNGTQKTIRKLHRQFEEAKSGRAVIDTSLALARAYRELGSEEDEMEWLSQAARRLRSSRRPSVERYEVNFRLFELCRLFGENSLRSLTKAMRHIELSLRDAERMGDESRIMQALQQKAFLLIASDSLDPTNLDRATELLQQLLRRGEANGNRPEMRHLVHGNLGIIAGKRGLVQQAREHFERSLGYFPPEESSARKASILKSLAKARYYLDGDAKEARSILEEALSIGSYQFAEVAILKDLEHICSEQGDHAAAYRYLVQRTTAEQKWNQMKVDTRIAAMQVKTELLDAKRKREIFELENVRLVAANNQIAAQRNALAEKNKHITDSITYARRLQEAVLPAREFLKEMLPQHFMLYLPKDVVAGDFFWAMRTGSYSYLAVADCTGHGVPGAMVSMICHNALTQTLQRGVVDTNEILDGARDLVKEAFSNSGAEVMDGMDISLVRISDDFRTLQFSGAHNPLWVIRGEEHIALKGDRQPVGSWVMERPFGSQSIQLCPGDMLYLFSDGFADQFGGPMNAKYRTKGLAELLMSVAPRPVEEQHEAVTYAFFDWMGEHEQMDDVSLMGIRV